MVSLFARCGYDLDPVRNGTETWRSVAENQILTGFWSYTRVDAQNSGGRLDALREGVAGELRLAGPRPPVELWHDTSNIE